MKILKVIHGYPMRFNAGSEVYSQTLCQALADRHEVRVFTREENLLKPDFSMHTELDPTDSRIQLHVVNSPSQRLHERYRNSEIDEHFRDLLNEFQPDIVHIGHLNHLSTSIVDVIDVPILFTLHDYWLMCPRGQFMQRNSKEPWALCNGQDDEKCARHCFNCRFSGNPKEEPTDVAYYTDWVKRRMDHMQEIVKKVDLFHAPSKYLLKRFHKEFGIPREKLVYLDYGFDLERLKGRKRTPNEPLTFGYIGTHIPAKGIHHLLKAFGQVKGDVRLRIWGRRRNATAALEEMASDPRIEWRSEYTNQNIVQDVFNHVDAIVVPSIWVENSPLVIHEALQAGVPVITANVGGMAEHVQHEVNGLLFEHRNPEDLASQMQRAVDKPLPKAGGYVMPIEEHVEEIEKLYSKVTKPGPWRITFDTNPDHCNYACTMCEGFSPHSKVREERVKAGIKPRVMPISLIRRIMDEAKGTPLREIIPSTMGEPLLYKDFEEIIELCHTHGVKLNLTTNGSFPIKGVDAWAKLIVPVGSDVKISWNGATKKTHEEIMRNSNWEKVNANLKTFIRIRNEHAEAGGNYCSVTLQLTFLQTNVHELADIVRLAIDNGVDRVKGHHLWAHFKEIKGLSMRRDIEAIQRWNQAVKEAMAVADQFPLPNGKRILLENIFPLNEEAEKDLAPGGPCPFLGKEAWVNTEGKFSPCCAPDKLRQTLGDFGSLQDKSMEEVWLGDDYNALRKNYQNHSLCVGCNMRKKL